MVWPNNYRTFGGWNPYRLTGRQFDFYKINRSGERFNKFINDNIPSTMAMPSGYYSSGWVVQPIQSGGMSSYLSVTGEGSLSATILAIRLALADLTGSGDLTAEGALVVQLIAALIGSGTITNADVQAFLAAVAALTGSGAISSATATGLGELLSSLIGNGIATSTLTATGELSADIVSFGALTIEGMREAVWSAVAASYNESGTMGEKMNNAASAGDPWGTALPGSYASGEAGQILAQIQTLVDELHKIQGLDASSPMTVTPTQRTAGTIDLSISGDGETVTVVERQP